MEQNHLEKPKISDEELERMEKEEKKRGFRVRDVRDRETSEEKEPEILPEEKGKTQEEIEREEMEQEKKPFRVIDKRAMTALKEEEKEVKQKAQEIYERRIKGEKEGFRWLEIDEILEKEGILPGTPEAEKRMRKWDWEKAQEELRNEKAGRKESVPEVEVKETAVEKPEEIRNKARKDYVDAKITYEKTSKRIGIMGRIREFFGSKSETKGAAGEEQKTAEENLKRTEEALKAVIDKYRQEMIEAKKKELLDNIVMTEDEKDEELEKYERQIAIETTVKEAIEIYNLKKETEIEISGGEKEKLSWLKTKGLEAAQWYRKQPIKQKILVAGVLLGTGVAAGIAGGAVGAALAGGALTGRWTQRVLSGAGTMVGLETWMKASQEKATRKEVSKILEEHGIEALLEEQSEALNKKLFELIGKKKGEERRRYLIAGIAGVVIGSGALSKAISEIIPDEWKHAVLGKLGFGQPAVSVEKPSLVDLPEEVQAPEVTPESAPEVSVVPAAAIEPDIWGQVNGIEEAYKGDSVWKMLERQIHARMGDNFDSLDKAQKIYIIDALKDKVAADPEKFHLIDIDKIPVGQRINFSEIFQNETGVKDIVSKAVNLRPEQMENILKESEAFRKGLAARVTETTIEPDEFGPASTPMYGTPLGPTSVPEQIIQPETPSAAPPLTEPEQLGRGSVPVQQPETPTTAPPGDQIPSDGTHQVEKFKVESEELPGGVRKEGVDISEDQFNLTGRENLDMKRIGELFNQGKIDPFKIKLLEDHSRNISSYLNQLKKIDLFSDEAKILKNSIKFIIDGDEKLYGKNIFSKEVYEILSWKQ